MREVFWRVAHKPGKPLWFGVAPTGALVFGVPGNPVSSLVCFELFVRPALGRHAARPAEPRPVARLAEPVARLRVRDHAVRCRSPPGADGMVLHPAGAQDSHMIVHASGADAVALIDAGDGEAPAGTLVEYLPPAVTAPSPSSAVGVLAPLGASTGCTRIGTSAGRGRPSAGTSTSAIVERSGCRPGRHAMEAAAPRPARRGVRRRHR